MDPQIAAGLIGGGATIAAAIIGWNFTKKNKAERDSQPEQPSNPVSVADITGIWLSDFNGEVDRFEITKIEGRKVNGTRWFKGKRDKAERTYDLVGYFDGVLLSLAATSRDPRETRTLSLVMTRKTGTRFNGRRTYLGKEGIISNYTRDWKRQN